MQHLLLKYISQAILSFIYSPIQPTTPLLSNHPITTRALLAKVRHVFLCRMIDGTVSNYVWRRFRFLLLTHECTTRPEHETRTRTGTTFSAYLLIFHFPATYTNTLARVGRTLCCSVLLTPYNLITSWGLPASSWKRSLLTLLASSYFEGRPSTFLHHHPRGRRHRLRMSGVIYDWKIKWGTGTQYAHICG